MKEQISYWISTVSTFAGLIPLVFGYLGFSKYLFAYRLFFFYVLLSFLNDLTGFILYTFVTREKLLFDQVYAYYTLVEPVLCLIFLATIYKKGSMLQKVIIAIIPLVIVIWFTQYLINNPSFNQSNIYDCLHSLFISLLSAYAILLMVERQDAEKFIYRFWFLSGLFIYFFCGTFLFLFFSAMKPLNGVINIVAYVIFTGGFITLNKSLKKVKQ